MIRYYISFVHQGDLGPDFGTADIARNQPISSVDDVQSVAAWLTQQGYRNPTVLAFSRYTSGDQPRNRAGSRR